jgi:hypothetical protein
MSPRPDSRDSRPAPPAAPGREKRRRRRQEERTVNQDGTYRALRWLVAYHALLVEERPARARRRGLESHRPIDSWWTAPAAATSSPPSISSAIATWSGSLAAAGSPTWPHNPGPVKPARHQGTRGNPSPSSPEAPRPCGTKRGRGAGILRWRSNPISAVELGCLTSLGAKKGDEAGRRLERGCRAKRRPACTATSPARAARPPRETASMTRCRSRRRSPGQGRRRSRRPALDEIQIRESASRCLSGRPMPGTHPPPTHTPAGAVSRRLPPRDMVIAATIILVAALGYLAFAWHHRAGG